MSFISFAATCLQAKRLTRLGRKMTALVVLGAAALGADVSASDAGVIVTIEAPSELVQNQSYTIKLKLSNTDNTSAFDWKFYADSNVSLQSYGKPSSNDLFPGPMDKDMISALDTLSSRIPSTPVGPSTGGYVAEYIFKATGDVGSTGQFASYAMSVSGSHLSPSYVDFDYTITPEPATLALIGLGSGLIGLSRRLRRRDEEKKAK